MRTFLEGGRLPIFLGTWKIPGSNLGTLSICVDPIGVVRSVRRGCNIPSRRDGRYRGDQCLRGGFRIRNRGNERVSSTELPGRAEQELRKLQSKRKKVRMRT